MRPHIQSQSEHTQSALDRARQIIREATLRYNIQQYGFYKSFIKKLNGLVRITVEESAQAGRWQRFIRSSAIISRRPLSVRVLRRLLSRILTIALISFTLLTVADTRHFNPAQREGAPYRFNITLWELTNAPDKWLYKAGSILRGQSAAAREQDTRDYFAMNAEMSQIRGGLRFAAAQDLRDETARFQALLDESEARADALSRGAEETVESYISKVLVDEGIGVFGDVLLPPVDVRLTQPPKLLIVSPRDKIDRKYETLIQQEVTLSEREDIEGRILLTYDMSALVEDIGGLATYPASVANGNAMRWTMQAAAHEWLHHYFFFQPLGRHMFDNGDMLQLNETIANVLGKEIGERVYAAMERDSLVPQRARPVAASNGAERPPFDFAAEMRQTRSEVDAMLADGRIDDAEAYMEERRHLFVANGYPIRKLNQAYFAFYGTYADLPAAVSPIGDQVMRFRELVPDLGDFIRAVSDFSSYNEFVSALEELEAANAG